MGCLRLSTLWWGLDPTQRTFDTVGCPRWLVERGITKLYLGRLNNVRETHWSATVNEKPDVEGEPMARLAARGHYSPRDSFECFEWDDHRWQYRDQSIKEDPANRSTHERNFPAGGTGTA